MLHVIGLHSWQKRTPIALLVILLTLPTIFLAPLPTWSQPNIIYVNATATGANNGTSWLNAYTNLQTALANAPVGSEIWVAQGLYEPAQCSNSCTPASSQRGTSFVLRNGIALYGGFFGTETARNERNWQRYSSVLSGDLNRNDGQVLFNNEENSYHVVRGNSGINSTAILDGFTIFGGNADGGPNNRGGGVLLENSSPTLTNLFIRGSQAEWGAGMYNERSSPTLTNVQFISNFANRDGGGMYNNGSSAATFTNLIFSGNFAGRGAGMYNEGSSLRLATATFSGNGTNDTTAGGGIYNSNSFLTIENSILWGNRAWLRPSIYNIQPPPPDPPAPPVVYLTIRSSLVQDSGGSGMNWDPVYGADGGGNLDTDPRFVLAVPDAPTPIGDLRLRPGSPAINVGNNDLIPTGMTTDYRSKPRISGGRVDMGAMEMQGYTIATSDGDDQAAQVNTAFPTPLQVTVSETGGSGIRNIAVNLSAPAIGASAVLSSTVATTDEWGRASVRATANAVAGSYSVTASASDFSGTTQFDLTNTTDPPTPTSTATVIPTATATEVPTTTATAIPTATTTAIPTTTATPDPSATAAPTASATPLPITTATAAPTTTATAAPTTTATPDPRASPTTTATATATATTPGAPHATPTVTASPGVTVTTTATPGNAPEPTQHRIFLPLVTR
ncbi:MAG: hypothetical protein MUD01_09290 [Chloroflexaceae bacterium]|jgi:hypothetical protein|nr:hypothetical protein [Chloroflexaceae bacterium]